MLQQARVTVGLLALRSRASKGFWVLLDQGVFAISNFAVNILFARWLAPVDYGWFVLSFSLSQFVAMLHFGVIQEPVLVQSAQVSRERRRAYVTTLFHAHIILLLGAAVIGFVGLAVAASLEQSNLGWAFVGGLTGGIAMLTNLIGRRLCFIFVSVRASAVVGAIYLFGSVLTGFALDRCWTVWWFDIWLIIGGWSAIGAVITFRLAYNGTSGIEPYPLAEVIATGRRYAHWGIAGSICGWLRSDGLFMMLGHFAGLAAVAETRAIFNLGSPLLQANMAVHTTALVGFSVDHSRGSKGNILRIAGLYSLGMAAFLPACQHFSPWLVHLFYHGQYDSGAWQLPLYCLTLGMGILDLITSSVFKAQGKMRSGYASLLMTGVVSVIAGGILVPLQHTLIYVLILSSASGLACALLLRMRAAV